jgi:cation diffusion facilitator CzcD-associated flavoprotein CzcO
MTNGERICIVGAGCSGLAAARHLLEQGYAVEVLERQRELGGNWNFSSPAGRVYRSTHTISSKRRTQFPDFPMPEEWPDYPHHSQVLEYLRRYAAEFGIDQRIEYETAVERIEPADEAATHWNVTLEDGTTRRYGGVVIANGHHWSPASPQYPGEFQGQTLHSAQYKSPEMFRGRRVLVVGGGNSGCDIAVEASHTAAAVFHSTRRGYHYIPKYLFGVPADLAGDTLHKLRLPLPLRRMITAATLRLAVGTPEQHGLRRPDHRLFETHPVINSLLPYYVRHGDVAAKPAVARLAGDTVEFVDGTREAIDTIVHATGYRVEFPFLDTRWLNWRDGRPRLYKHLFHPRFDNLFVVGMIQPDSGIFGLVLWQAKLVAMSLRAWKRQSRAAERFRRMKQHVDEPLDGGIRYDRSPRHSLEVEHWSYLRGLRRLAAVLQSD